ncbi:MAG TPA: hypothetical protein PKD61_22540 [Polyangiaceae bacterium]|nr:hypothetical protein [Polyangiaceae bacterium]
MSCTTYWYSCFWAAVTLALPGCGPSAAQTTPAQPIVNSAPPAGAPAPQSELQRLRKHLAHAEEKARHAGWLKKEVVEIPDPPAAIVLYEPAPDQAPATLVARFDAVSAAGSQVLTGQSGMVDVQKTKQGALLWDLRGNGSRSVVLHLTPCGASCGQAQPRVLDLTAAGFADATAAPECPTCATDLDRDRIPEFAYRMVNLKVAACARVSCGPSYALEVQVRGLESWEAGAFQRDLRDFIPLYFDRLRDAKRDAKRARRAKNKSEVCPLNALRVASELYVYGQLIGEKEADALKSADAVMAGYSMGPCEQEYDLLGPPRTWGELREELTKVKLQKLERWRQVKK